MKTLTLSAAAFAAAAYTGDALAQGLQNLPPAYRDQHRHDEHDRDRGRVGDQSQLIRQRVDRLADVIDDVAEHLEDDLESGHGDPGHRRLFAQADAALREATHFADSVGPGTPPREIYDHFGVLDRQVHSLMEGIQATNDAALRRQASRLAYADEQLHAAVAAGQGGGPPAGNYVARQAHVLAAEAQRLERSARLTIAEQDRNARGDHRGDRELLDGLHAFVDRVEHFHETAENENDRAHLARDFADVDRAWHQVVELMNRNPHGAYLSRRAQRVGAMHDALAQVIGVQGDRQVIRFNLGGIGVDIGR